MHKKIKVFGALLTAAVGLSIPAGATEILTTSYTTWKSTITGTAVEWNDVVSASTYNTAAGFSMPLGSFGPLTVTGPDGSAYYLDKQYYGSGTSLEGAVDGTGSVQIATPAAGLTGFLMELGVNGTQAPITITLSDGETFTASPTANGGVAWIGLSSGTSITSINLSTTSGSRVEVVDFLAGNSSEPAQAPAVEVATALMIGSGLLVIGGVRKVFSNVSASAA